MTEKSILEQALLQVQTLEEAVKQNAKGILSSTMKQELNQMLKEQEEEEEETDDVESPKEDEEVVASDEMSDEEDDSKEDETDEMSDESDNDEVAKNIDSMDTEDLPVEDEEMPVSNDMGMPSQEDDDVMDMTGASDEELVKVFKAMKPEDGIVVKKEGNNVELETGEEEYIIKLDEEEMTHEEEAMEGDMSHSEVEEGDMLDSEMTEGDMMPTDEEEETVYEIELSETEEEEEESVKEPKETKHAKKVEATEAARTKSNPHGNKGGANRAGLPSKKKYAAGSGSLNEEVTELRKQNGEYKKALVLFKEKLNEVAVFNANLAYATRLFTEHSTTKSEKLNILKRFDGVNTISESKNLYKTIKTELEIKKPVTESVVDKISNTPSTSTSSTTEVLSESKAYENPQFRRMKDLMTKIK